MYNNLFYSLMTDQNIKKSEDNEDLDSFQYLINYFTNVDVEKCEDENNTNGCFDMYLEDMNKINDEEFKKIRKVTQKDLDLSYLKIYLQVKNELEKSYEENYFDENEIIRCIIGLKFNYFFIQRRL